MFTKAARQALQTVPTWTTVADSRNTIPMFPNDSIRNTNNDERWVSLLDGNLISTLSCGGYYQWSGFKFGSGNTAPTINDYALETPLTDSDYSATLTNTVRGVDNGVPYMEFTFVLTNISSSSITVSEVCYVSNNITVCTSSSGTSVARNDIMVDRTLLASPVTIAAGDTAAIKYRISCDMSFS